MTPEELDFILKNGEGYRTEFKERLSSSLTKEICAFANASGGLPKSLSPEEFGRKSVVRNPNIAAMLQRFGYVERMGTGIKRVNDLCELNGNPKPRYEFTTFFTVIYDRETDQVTGQVTDQVRRVLELLVDGEKSIRVLMSIIGLKHRNNFMKLSIYPTISAELIELTEPDSPNSPTQKYRLTDKGRNLINE